MIETGVWRGGASIYMRGILAAHGVENRDVWVADSFAGLPEPDHPTVLGLVDASEWLAVSLDEVRENFARYRLLDERVHFVKGWFRDTLPRSVTVIGPWCDSTATCTSPRWTA